MVGLNNNRKPQRDWPRRLVVAINDEIKYKADLLSDKHAANSLTHCYKQKSLSLNEFAAEIRQRNNFTAIFLSKRGQFHRAKEHFRQSDLVPIDFDNSKYILIDGPGGRKVKRKVKVDPAHYVTLEQTLENPFIRLFGAIAYTTSSHTADWHHFRVIFVIPRTVKNRTQFERILAAFIWRFKSDPACSDASRFFYGAGEGGKVIVLGNCLTSDVLISLLKEHHRATWQPKRRQKGNRACPANGGTSAESSDCVLSDSYLVEKALNDEYGSEFEALWGGDISAFNSASEADWALVKKLCFYSQDDEQVKRLWLASGLSRDKLFNHPTYVPNTIAKIRTKQISFYSGNGKPSVETDAQLTGREQIICRCFAFWGISDESFRTYIAMCAIFNGRKTARVSGALLGRHIKVREVGDVESSKELYGRNQRFGNRRINQLLEELRERVDYPLLRRIEKGKRKVRIVAGVEESELIPARYKLDEKLFDEAEELAAAHPAMREGRGYNPGKAREEAALVIARIYTNQSEPSERPDPPKKDEYAQWVDAEKLALKQIQRISDLLDDLNKSTVERQAYTKQFLRQAERILLLKITKNMRRKRKKKEGVTGLGFEVVGSSMTLPNESYETAHLGVINNDVNTIADNSENGVVDALLEKDMEGFV
ncbi:MAG TPA: hypothetical protein VF131_28700 [Blastocatellia bacterium]|nr:hypothetical protein [Blastocatellia bacterium]